MLNSVAHRVANALAEVGFEPDPLHGKLVGARIIDRGEQEFKCLRQEIASIRRSREVCAHYLGTGASFTEFLISGLPLERAFKREIASLGGIANAIVAIFDKLLDVSHAAPVLFGERPPLSADPEVSAKQELVIDLTALYFRKLDSFPSANPRVRTLLERAIRRLYDAELRTAQTDPASWGAWWRKNSLLTVIMGLPAWLYMQDGDRTEFAKHLMWLGRVGEFLGWLDDAADYELDRTAGSANWLHLRPESSLDACAKQIAAKGLRVLKFWDARNADSPARDTFTVISWMWLSAP